MEWLYNRRRLNRFWRLFVGDIIGKFEILDAVLDKIIYYFVIVLFI